MEEELEKQKRRYSSTSESNIKDVESEEAKEIIGLRSKLEKLEAEYVDSMDKTQSRYSSEVARLREQIQESEITRESIQKEANLLKEKVDHLRFESTTDNEESIIDMKRHHEREKLLLMEDNDRLLSELDKVLVR